MMTKYLILLLLFISCANSPSRDLANTFDIAKAPKVYNKANDSLYYIRENRLYRYSFKLKKDYIIKDIGYSISKVFLIDDAKEPTLAFWSKSKLLGTDLKQVGIGTIRRNKFYQTQYLAPDVPDASDLDLSFVHRHKNKMIFFYEKDRGPYNKVGFRYQSELPSDVKLKIRKPLGYIGSDPEPGRLRTELGFKNSDTVIKMSSKDYSEVLYRYYVKNRKFPKNLELFTFSPKTNTWNLERSFNYFNSFDATLDLSKIVLLNREEKMISVFNGKNYTILDSKYAGNFVEFSPDQKFFSVASADEKVVSVYNAAETKKAYQFNFSHKIRSVDYLDTGNIRVVLENGEVMEAKPGIKGANRITKVADFGRKLARDIRLSIDKNLLMKAIAEDGSEVTTLIGKNCSNLLR